jgi:hypothetical protein
VYHITPPVSPYPFSKKPKKTEKNKNLKTSKLAERWSFLELHPAASFYPSIIASHYTISSLSISITKKNQKK